MERLKKPRQSTENGGSGPRPPSSRILLVEDHAALAAMRRDALRKQGYAVVLTADGLEACRLLEIERFDLVVTDVRLPEGDGWEVAQTAKKNRVPVILSTGWSPPSHTHDADYVLKKPSSIANLLALVHRALTEAESSASEARG